MSDLPSSMVSPSTAADAPLIVVCSFLSRADSTPLAERPRAPGHLLDSDGVEIADPAADPGANAFESDPNLNFEKWSDYWRKVHGVRFLHVEDKDDRSLDRLQRYDQIHRLPAGPASLSPPPYRAPLDAQGQLFPTVIGQIAPYRRPRWDGIACLAFETVEDVATVLTSERVRRKILPEDQVMFRDIAPLLARQHVIKPREPGRDAIVLVKTHVRPAALDRAGFQRHWLQAHADLVLAQPETTTLVTRYVQLHNIGPVSEGEPFFHSATHAIDGVSMMAFASMTDVEAFLLSDGYRVISDDERAFSQIEAGDYATGLTINLLARQHPERSSRRT